MAHFKRNLIGTVNAFKYLVSTPIQRAYDCHRSSKKTFFLFPTRFL